MVSTQPSKTLSIELIRSLEPMPNFFISGLQSHIMMDEITILSFEVKIQTKNFTIQEYKKQLKILNLINIFKIQTNIVYSVL